MPCVCFLLWKRGLIFREESCHTGDATGHVMVGQETHVLRDQRLNHSHAGPFCNRYIILRAYAKTWSPAATHLTSSDPPGTLIYPLPTVQKNKAHTCNLLGGSWNFVTT